MKQRKFWRLLLLCFVFLFAVPAIPALQEPMQAEAAAPKLSKKKATVKEGKTITLTVKNPTKKVIWKSSNSKIVKITKKTGSKTSKATLKGIKKGTATITAKVGKKKLTAKITVKHVHIWRGYATCTEPDKCKTCGAKRGLPLGHNFTSATCLKPATCQRCGVTQGGLGAHTPSGRATCTEPDKCKVCGAKIGDPLKHDFTPATCQRCGVTQGGLGAHTWNQNDICTLCNTMDINRILDMRISNNAIGGNPKNWVDIDITNTRRQMFSIDSTNSRIPAAATLNINGRAIPVYLFDENSGSFLFHFASSNGLDAISFLIESRDTDDFFVVTYTSSVVFDFSYFNQKTKQNERFRATVTPTGSTCIKY